MLKLAVAAFLAALSLLPALSALSLAETLDWSSDPVAQTAVRKSVMEFALDPPALAFQAPSPTNPSGAPWAILREVLSVDGVTPGFFETSRAEALRAAENDLEWAVYFQGAPGKHFVKPGLEGIWEIKSVTTDGPPTIRMERIQGCPRCPTHYRAHLSQQVIRERYVCVNLRLLADGKREASCPSGIRIFPERN